MKGAKQKKLRNTRGYMIPSVLGEVISNKESLTRLRLNHTEYITDMVMPTGASTQRTVIPINPGLSAAFPWLSAIAVNFETYKFLKLEYRWITVVGTSTSGSVLIVPDYDATDAVKDVKKSRLLSYQDAVRGPMWNSFVMRCSKKNLVKLENKFTRRVNTLTGDPRLSDVGNLVVELNKPSAATEDTTLGELWVNYDVILETPQFEPDNQLAMTFYPEQEPSGYGTSVDYPFAQFSTFGLLPIDTVGNMDDIVEISDLDDSHISISRPGYYLFDADVETISDPVTNIHSLGEVPGAKNPPGSELYELAKRFTGAGPDGAMLETLIKVGPAASKLLPYIIRWAGLNSSPDGDRMIGDYSLLPITEAVFEVLKSTHPLSKKKFSSKEVKQARKRLDEIRKKAKLRVIKKPKKGTSGSESDSE